MKQGYRFFFKPGAFVNQLQWSSSHGFILTAFVASALVETQAGRNQGIYALFASVLAARSGVSLDMAIWLVIFAKLAVMLIGALALAELILWLGNLFGRNVSRRVLFRRLAVVFSMLLMAHTTQLYSAIMPEAAVLAVALWTWGAVLGYFALREQFRLTLTEAIAIGVFAAFLGVGGWNLTLYSLQKSIRQSAPAIAKRPTPKVRHRPFFK